MSNDESSSESSWPSPDQTGATVNSDLAPTKKFALSTLFKQKKRIAIPLLVLVLLTGYFTFANGDSGASASSNSEWIAYDYRGDGNYDMYLASLKDGQVVSGTRIADDNFQSIYVYGSLDSETYTYASFVKDADTIYTWGVDGDDKELKAISVKDGTSTSIYRGTDIGYVTYIEDKKTFLVSDDGNCFAAKKDVPSIRLGYGGCMVYNGSVLTYKSSSEDVVINMTNLDGESSGRNTFPFVGDWSIRNNGRLITGLTQDGVFEVYSVSTGKRVITTKATETVTVLSESSKSSNLLLAIEDSELDDEVITVGVMIASEGGAAFEKFATPFAAKGFLSPSGDEFLLGARKTQDSESVSITRYKIGSKEATEVATADSIVSTWKDEFGRVAIVTDSEIISGTFKNGFQPSVTGSFDSEDSGMDMYSAANSKGIFVVSNSEKKSDLYFIGDAKSDGKNRSYITLATGGSGISLDQTSLAQSGSIVYSETSNGYVELYKQEISNNSPRKKIAEGRITNYQVMGSDEYYYYEKEDDSISMYQMKGDKPKDRKTISTQYAYVKVATGLNTGGLLYMSSFALGDWTLASVDDDFRSCKENGSQILNLDESIELRLPRSNADYNYDNEKVEFCVTSNGEGGIVYIPSFINSADYRSVYFDLSCSDEDSSWRDQERYQGYSGGSSADVVIPSARGTYTCILYDAQRYGYYDTAMGSTAIVALKPND